MEKKSFKIFLDSNNTNSWTGQLYNAKYNVDLNQLVIIVNVLKKSYYMYCSFISTANDVTVNSLTTSNVYTLHIDMCKNINVYQFKNIKLPSFILPVEVINNVLGTPDPDTRFNLQDYQQQPTYINNILNLNNIQIHVINTLTDSTFIGNNNYVCVLTFVQA